MNFKKKKTCVGRLFEVQNYSFKRATKKSYRKNFSSLDKEKNYRYYKSPIFTFMLLNKNEHTST